MPLRPSGNAVELHEGATAPFDYEVPIRRLD